LEEKLPLLILTQNQTSGKKGFGRYPLEFVVIYLFFLGVRAINSETGITTLPTVNAECPGFGQGRVNFHRTPGRGTAGGGG